MEQQLPRECEGVHLKLPPHILFHPSNVWSMLHHSQWSRVQNKIKEAQP